MKTQQCCVLSSAIGTVLLGIALVSVARLLLDQDVVLRSLEPSYAFGVYVLGAFVCFVGLCGICGSCFSSRLTLSVYGLGDLLAAIVGLIIGSTLLFTANMHSMNINQSCSQFRASGKSSSALGKRYQTSYDSMKQALQNCRQNGRPGALGLQDCGQLGRDNNGKWFQEDPQRQLLSYTENFSGCGGFCVSDLPLFGFPSSGRAMDQASKTTRRDPCYTTVADELLARGSMKGVAIIFLSLPLLVSFCGASWILCYPPSRARKDYVNPWDVDSLESDRLLSYEDDRVASPEYSDEE